MRLKVNSLTGCPRVRPSNFGAAEWATTVWVTRADGREQRVAPSLARRTSRWTPLRRPMT